LTWVARQAGAWPEPCENDSAALTGAAARPLGDVAAAVKNSLKAGRNTPDATTQRAKISARIGHVMEYLRNGNDFVALLG